MSVLVNCMHRFDDPRRCRQCIRQRNKVCLAFERAERHYAVSTAEASVIRAAMRWAGKRHGKSANQRLLEAACAELERARALRDRADNAKVWRPMDWRLDWRPR